MTNSEHLSTCDETDYENKGLLAVLSNIFHSCTVTLEVFADIAKFLLYFSFRM